MSRPFAPPYAPYANEAASALYELLFCDDSSSYAAKPGQEPAAWQRILFAEPPDPAALRALADDATQEGRVRHLACARLRERGQPVPAKRLHGVVVEVPVEGGLDTLAAYAEGGVRYINHSGAMSIVEGVDALGARVAALLEAAAAVVGRIGPSAEPRRPPPAPGLVRLSFLTSDGLCFGEGPMATMARDAMAGPVVAQAVALLQAVFELRSDRNREHGSRVDDHRGLGDARVVLGLGRRAPDRSGL